MCDCAIFEWLVKTFKLKRCMNCRFHLCGQCTWSRTACQMPKFRKACHNFSYNGYYARYKEFLTKAIKYHDKHGITATYGYVDRIRRKYRIEKFLLASTPSYTRIWFNMEGDNHYCHFGTDWYELDANVTLEVDKVRRR